MDWSADWWKRETRLLELLPAEFAEVTFASFVGKCAEQSGGRNDGKPATSASQPKPATTVKGEKVVNSECIKFMESDTAKRTRGNYYLRLVWSDGSLTWTNDMCEPPTGSTSRIN